MLEHAKSDDDDKLEHKYMHAEKKGYDRDVFIKGENSFITKVKVAKKKDHQHGYTFELAVAGTLDEDKMDELKEAIKGEEKKTNVKKEQKKEVKEGLNAFEKKVRAEDKKKLEKDLKKELHNATKEIKHDVKQE